MDFLSDFLPPERKKVPEAKRTDSWEQEIPLPDNLTPQGIPGWVSHRAREYLISVLQVTVMIQVLTESRRLKMKSSHEPYWFWKAQHDGFTYIITAELTRRKTHVRIKIEEFNSAITPPDALF